MIRTKRVALVAALVAAAAVLAGCAGGGGSSAATTGTLKFYTDKAAWKPDFESLNTQSQKSEKISLKTSGYADEAQYQAFIKQAFKTKQSPGLFTWSTGPNLKDLVDKGLVADTSDIWKDAISKGYVSKDLEKYYTFGGKQYCVPMNVAYWVMYYSIPTFKKFGIGVPTTWDQLTAAAQKLKDNGITPLYQTSSLFTFPWFETLVAGTDPDLYQKLGTGDAKYTDPTVEKAMDTWLEQEKKGWFTDAGSKDDPAAMFKQGDMAMINFGTWFSGNLKGVDMKSGTDYGTFVIPAVKSSLGQTPVPVETGPLCTAANSPQKDLGLAYAKWWMTPAAQSAWGDRRGDVPFNTKATVSDTSLADLGKTVSNPDHRLVTRYFELAPAAVVNTAIEQWGAFVANPGDPKPFLEKIQTAQDQYEQDKG